MSALQIICDALSLGSLYALGALGIALIFGVMRLMNFTHGDVIAFCIFAPLWPSVNAIAIVFAGNLSWFLLVPFVLAMGAGLSVLCEFVIFRRFRNTSPATMMIASFSLGFVIRYFLLMLNSSRPKSIALLPELSQPVTVLGARMPLLQLITILVRVGVLVGLTIFLRRTRFGLEMRAAAENFTMARMLGVRANRVIMIAFALSGALAAAIALILGSQTGTASIMMGANVMLMAFIATVIGGMGSFAGAVLAGFLLGATATLLQALLPPEARAFRDAFVYGAVILVLIFRSQGILSAGDMKGRV
ncbi:branched-chain amino acid ABC transporter permease [Pseudomonas sp. GX19020]|uniref:branched-chain amino acid ABC transporter permease n=1 Tax=Pseudomonas sp. GX19020 TaxID=2942277 RepID=UPI002019F882|nr:branched-chain amino acid ABC transporter permease [Pseudomonas sp. GX19020]MCL4067043.1 branched-chain amino acid ABC transporter permease [Pseudomonas sp. GX19020]